MKKLIEFFRLRDPTWQAIGTITGVIAIIVSTIAAYDILQQSTPISNLTVTEIYNFDPLQFGEAMDGRIALLIDGVEAESVRVYYYSISNTGQNPIRKDDFVEPIQVSVKEPWKLLAVDTDWSSPPELDVKWNRVMTNTFEMVPTLLNAGDTLRVLFFLTNPSEGEELPNPNCKVTALSRPQNGQFEDRHGIYSIVSG